MSEMLFDYTVDVTEKDWYLLCSDGGCNKDLSFTLVEIGMPERGADATRHLGISFGSGDYLEGENTDQNLEPVHPEMDRVLQGKKLRIRFSIEEIE